MSIGEDNETFFIRVWKPFPSRHVLKTLRGSLGSRKGQNPKEDNSITMMSISLFLE